MPVIVNEENFPVIGANACIEYIRDLEVKPRLFVDDYREKAEINILFSPACSSFDQFKNFEQRGRCFKKYLKKILKND